MIDVNFELQLAPVETLDLSKACRVGLAFDDFSGEPMPAVIDRRSGAVLMTFGGRTLAAAFEQAFRSLKPFDRRRAVRS